MDLPNELAEELRSELYLLLARHFYSRDTADYNECAFCRATANDIRGHQQDIKHGAKCLGIRLQEALDKGL